MRAEDQYLKFVLWSEEDGVYVGYCPDLFPWGGVCHAEDEGEAYAQLCILVAEEVEELKAANRPLPTPSTRPMREAVQA